MGIVALAVLLPQLAPAAVFAQIETGLLGMTLQAVLVPFAVMGLRKLLQRDKNA